MPTERPNHGHKSFYVFLCSLLGVLLFLVIHRVAWAAYFFILSTTGAGPFAGGIDTTTAVALDQFTLVFALMGGAWYGAWLGLSWYSQVYESEEHPGWVAYGLSQLRLSPLSNTENLRGRVARVAEELELAAHELEDAVPKISARRKASTRRTSANAQVPAKPARTRKAAVTSKTKTVSPKKRVTRQLIPLVA